VKLVQDVSCSVETATVRSELDMCCVKLKNGEIAILNFTNTRIYVVRTRCFSSRVR